jgi:hypothetical protein
VVSLSRHDPSGVAKRQGASTGASAFIVIS